MLLSTRAAGEGSGSETLLHSGGGLCSIHAVTRQLKREQNSLFNCLNSIVSDRSFVEEIRSLYPGIPLLANLRCGLWYTPNADGTCYFKSTDGHTGKWAFSTVRLNLHVARLASVKGGVMMVDATRKGKTFTDAFSKTVPIWCAVLNRAVARLRQLQQQGQGPSQQGRSTAPGHARAACDGATAARRDAGQAVQPPCLSGDWDCAVHLPLWVPRNEALQIEARLEGWVDQLMAIGADIKGLAQVSNLNPGERANLGKALGVLRASGAIMLQVCGHEQEKVKMLLKTAANFRTRVCDGVGHTLLTLCKHDAPHQAADMHLRMHPAAHTAFACNAAVRLEQPPHTPQEKQLAEQCLCTTAVPLISNSHDS